MATAPLVYLIDPREDDREQISRQLESVKSEFCAFHDVGEFFAAYEPSRLGCLLTELQLGSITVFQLVKHLRQGPSSLPVVLLTAHATVPLTVQAFRLGLFEVLEKPSEAFQLWDCVTRAFENHGKALDRARNRDGIQQRVFQLSRQELRVMQMLLNGTPNKNIAAELGLSPRTIVFRRKSLMQKMKAKSVGELARMVQLVANEDSPSFNVDTAALLEAHVADSSCGVANEDNSLNGNFY